MFGFFWVYLLIVLAQNSQKHKETTIAIHHKENLKEISRNKYIFKKTTPITYSNKLSNKYRSNSTLVSDQYTQRQLIMQN